MSTVKKAIGSVSTDPESGVIFARARTAPEVEANRARFLDGEAIDAAQAHLTDFDDRLNILNSMSSVFDDDEDDGPISMGGRAKPVVAAPKPVLSGSAVAPPAALPDASGFDDEDDVSVVTIGGLSDAPADVDFMPDIFNPDADPLLAPFLGEGENPAGDDEAVADVEETPASVEEPIDFFQANDADIELNEAATQAALALSEAEVAHEEDLAFLQDDIGDADDADAGTDEDLVDLAPVPEIEIDFEAPVTDEFLDQDLSSILSRSQTAPVAGPIERGLRFEDDETVADAELLTDANYEPAGAIDFDVPEAEGDMVAASDADGDAFDAELAGADQSLDAPRPDWGYVDDDMRIPGSSYEDDPKPVPALDDDALGLDDPALQSHAWEIAEEEESLTADVGADQLSTDLDALWDARDEVADTSTDENGIQDWAYTEEGTEDLSQKDANFEHEETAGDYGVKAQQYDQGDAREPEADAADWAIGDDSERGDDAQAEEAEPVKGASTQKPKSGRVMMLAASVGVVALIAGGGFMFANQLGLLGGSAPAPRVVTEVTPAVVPPLADAAAPTVNNDAVPVVTAGAETALPAAEDIPSNDGLVPDLSDLPGMDTVTADPVSDDAIPDDGSLADLAMPSIPAPEPLAEELAPAGENQMELDRIARGLESAAEGNLDSLFLTDEQPDLVTEEPAFDTTVVTDLLVDYAKKSDVTETREAIDLLFEKVNVISEEVVERDQRILELEGRLNEASEKAQRAETLALAQNEVLVEFVRVQEKVDMAESLIVDLSRRIAAMETTDPADRVAVERSLEDLTSRMEAMARDIGLVARIAINGSPEKVRPAGPGTNAVPGSESVYATTKSGAAPQGDPGRVPSNVKVGDFVEGYGYVLQIMPTSDGSRVVVMENNSVLLPN